MDWLSSNNVSLILTNSRFAIQEERIDLGGKFVWKSKIGEKIPLKIIIGYLTLLDGMKKPLKHYMVLKQSWGLKMADYYSMVS